ncbi:MAG: hypothetical protein ACR2JE_03750 [Acidobacteriaceae bacterium]
MPTHNPHDEHGEHAPHGAHGLTPSGRGTDSPGYETSDVKVGGILVFLVSLGIFVAIFFVFCFGMGKVINNALIKHDGPPNKWNQMAQAPGNGKLKNMESSAVMEQQQLKMMTARFPTPRLQMDDGDQDLADLHAREDLLLDHYTWINREQGALRIPIGRAMEVIAQQGLPVIAPAAEPAMTADQRDALSLPLTNGFARTGFEQRVETEESRKQESHRPRTGEQASLAPAH